jgi:hypothetical protein
MKVTFTFDDTDPNIVAVLGENIGEKLADNKGYTSEIPNPDYTPGGDEDPTIPNPDTKAEHLGKQTLKGAVLPFLTQELSAAEHKATDAKVAQIKAVIEGATVITTD